MLLKLAVSKRKNIKVIEQEILNMENDFNNPQGDKTKKKKRELRTKSQGVELILCLE
jgi:hypothetical protein